MKRRTVFPAVAALALAAIAAPQVRAQLQVTPSVGMYIPHGTPLVDQPGLTANRPLLRKVPVGGAVFSARIENWFDSHLGLQANVGYSPALIAVNSLGSVNDISAKLLLSNVGAVYRLQLDKEGTISAQLGSGLGYVKRSGDAWADTPAHPSLAFVLSTGARAHLNPRSPILFTAYLEDYMSWQEFKSTSGERLSSKLYHDVIFTMGIGIPFGKRETPLPPKPE